MYNEILRLMNEASAQGLSLGNFSIEHNREFLQAIKHSNEVFSAFKTHRMGMSMQARLLDSKGNLKSFSQWKNDVKSIASHHVGAWLQTEYNTAVLRAHNASDWREFLANKDILPNLRWMPTTSPDAEATHRGFWEKKLTLPVEYPFWNKHHPGDRWNCKCALEATDEPASPDSVLEDIPDIKPQAGLENNPGKDGHLISDKHPYFPKNCNSCAFYKKGGVKNRLKSWFVNQEKNCFNCSFVDGCIHSEQEKNRILRLRAKEIRAEVEFLKSSNPINKEFPHSINVYTTSIKEWLNQPHKHYKEKNELLISFLDIFYNATYRGRTRDNEERDGVRFTHVFEIDINKEKSWILVHQMRWGEYKLHSVSDSEKVTKKIEKIIEI